METQNKKITEDYVSFETAKLLKEKGFLKGVDLRMTQNLSFYDNIGLTHNLNKYYDRLIQDKIDFVVAPTLQMAMKWLRKVHDICVYCYNTNSRSKQYGKYEAGASWISDDVSVIFYNSTHSLYSDTYEQAIEEVLKYCLTNLID